MSGSHSLPGGRMTPFAVQVRDLLQSTYYKGKKFEAPQPGLVVGRGYRAYLSSLGRFIQPDVLSPFGHGGRNAYGYCLNDPVNRIDPSGAASIGKLFSRLLRRGVRKSRGGSKVSKDTSVKRLRNGYPHHLEAEYNLFAKNYTQDPRRIITTTPDVARLDTGVEYKFVFADDRLIVSPSGAKGGQRYISHAVVAELMPGAPVESAGMLSKGSLGEILLTNHSGHFRPDAMRLERPARYLEGLGFDVVRQAIH